MKCKVPSDMATFNYCMFPGSCGLRNFYVDVLSSKGSVKKVISLFISWLYIFFITPGLAVAASINVTAEYKPDASNIDESRFISTTKCYTYSTFFRLKTCNGGVSSLDSLLFATSAVNVRREAKGGGGDPMDSFMYVRIPRKRDVILTSGSGDTFKVSFVPSYMGSITHALYPNDASEYVLFLALQRPKGGCHFVDGRRDPDGGAGSLITHWYAIWRGEPGTTCYIDQSVSIGRSIPKVVEVYFGFKINPPSPLEIPNGIYKGSIILSIGPDGDISFGNGVYSDSQLTINLTLEVRHQLKVLFPNNVTQLSLKAAGGWGQNVPKPLAAVLPARIWASAPYNIKLKCQFLNSTGDRCLIRNDRKKHSVPVDVYAMGDNKNPRSIRPDKYEVFNQREVLIDMERPFKFEVKKEYVMEMMKNAGDKYNGNITIVIDATI